MTKLALDPLKHGWLVTALISVILVLGARHLTWLEAVELRLFDTVQSAVLGDEIRQDITVVLIDDDDIERFGWPLPDRILSEAAERILSANPKVLGIDLFREEPLGDASAALDAVQVDPRVVWISRLFAQPGSGSRAPAAVSEDNRDGFADFPIDKDGTARRALMMVATADDLELSFAYRVALLAQGEIQPSASASDPAVLAFGQTDLPPIDETFGAYMSVDAAGYQVLIDFENALPVVQTISLRDVMEDTPIDVLAGKIVLIGSGSDVVKDQFRTALNAGLSPSQQTSFTFGIQLHAVVIAQFLDNYAGLKGPVTSPSQILIWIVVCAAATGGAFVVGRARTAAAAILGGPVMAGVILVGLTLPLQWNIWFPSLPVALAWATSSLLALSMLMASARRDRRALRRLFAAHVSPDLVEEIWDNRDLVLSGGRPAPKSLFCTVLFADLYGTTRFGGTVEPDQFGEWLGRFLDTMSRCAHDNAGFVEKYTGDGIMLVFGAPFPDMTEAARRLSAQRAARCARQMLEGVSRLNKNAMHPYRIRVGIHSGEVLCGTFGQTGSRQYTVLGDAANIASRIEEFGKKQSKSGTSPGIVCISEFTANMLSNDFETRACGRLQHDSGHEVFEIYEIVYDAKPQET